MKASKQLLSAILAEPNRQNAAGSGGWLAVNRKTGALRAEWGGSIETKVRVYLGAAQ